MVVRLCIRIKLTFLLRVKGKPNHEEEQVNPAAKTDWKHSGYLGIITFHNTANQNEANHKPKEILFQTDKTNILKFHIVKIPKV